MFVCFPWGKTRVMGCPSRWWPTRERATSQKRHMEACVIYRQTAAKRGVGGQPAFFSFLYDLLDLWIPHHLVRVAVSDLPGRVRSSAQCCSKTGASSCLAARSCPPDASDPTCKCLPFQHNNGSGSCKYLPCRIIEILGNLSVRGSRASRCRSNVGGEVSYS